MSTAEQPTTKFAKGKQHANNMFSDKVFEDAYYGPMPDYADNPTNWESRMKMRMSSRKVLARFGMGKRDMTTTMLIDATFQNVRKIEKMGNEQAVWAEFHKQLRAHVRKRRKARADNAEYAANRREVEDYGKLVGASPSIVTQFLMGTNAKPFDVEFVKRRIDKHMENEQSYAEYKNAFPRDKDGKPVDDPKTDELNAVLGALVGADDEGDELTVPVWSAVYAPENKQQMLAFKHFERELKAIDAVAVVTTSILIALDNVPLGIHIQEHGIELTCKKLQSFLDKARAFQNAPQRAIDVPPAIPVQGSPSDAPEAAPVSAEKLNKKENVEVTQHLLKVYPVNFGGTYYKGIKFSVTLCSDDATWDDAIKLMEQFAAHREFIAPDCFVPQQATNVTPMAPQPSAAPATAPVPAVQGNKPVQSEQVVKVEREFDKDKKFEYTGLYTNFGNAPGKYATYKVKDGTPMAAKVNAITGIDWSSTKMGAEAPGGFIAWFTDADKMNASGKPYHDLVDLSATMERSA